MLSGDDSELRRKRTACRQARADCPRHACGRRQRAEAAARWSAEAAARRPRVTGRPRALSLARRRNECTYVRRARRAGPSHHRPSTIPRAGSIVGHPPHARHDVTPARAGPSSPSLARCCERERDRTGRRASSEDARAGPLARSQSRPRRVGPAAAATSHLSSPRLVPRARDRPPLVKNRPRRHDPFLPPPLRVWFVLARRCGSR